MKRPVGNQEVVFINTPKLLLKLSLSTYDLPVTIMKE